MKVKLYSMQEIAALVLAQGVDPWQAVTAVQVAWAESGGNAYAVGLNDQNPDSAAYLSLDLGVWQTNTFWHAEIPTRHAFDPAQQVLHVLRIARRVGQYGYVYYSWTAWSAFNNGAYKVFATDAVRAVRAAGGNI